MNTMTDAAALASADAAPSFRDELLARGILIDTGENGLYLHGAPYFIAPESQTRIPMLLWMSDGFRARRGLDAACIAARRGAELSQDNLFDTLLGLLGVRTTAYRPALDAFGGCATAAQTANPQATH